MAPASLSDGPWMPPSLRTHCSDYVTRLAWGCVGILPEVLDEVSGEREAWVSLLRLLPPRPVPDKRGMMVWDETAASP